MRYAPPRSARLETERLLLTPLVVSDADEMVEVLADPRLYEHTGGSPPDLVALRERYTRQAIGSSPDGSEFWFNWIVRNRELGAAVGYVQATFVIDNRSVDVAWVVGANYQGRGFAAEAAAAALGWLTSRLCVRRVTAHIAAANRPSQAVAGRLGLMPTDRIEAGEVVWQRQTAL
jgi:RimJ/RimL family protein N-acetyltransferase